MASKPKMVTAVFRDRANAQAAYDMLRARGYLDNEINVLMSDKTRSTYFATTEEEKEKHKAGTMATEGMGVGGAIGTAVGATLAAVAAIGSTIVLPVFGGLVVAGPLAAALAGGGAGALTGGLVGALVGWGIPESNAKAYEEALREGGVAIGVVPRDRDEARKIEDEFKNLQGENICYC
jgi:hypothetical protein